VMTQAVEHPKGAKFFRKYIDDPETFYIFYECPNCGHFDPHRKTKVRELLAARLAGMSLFCSQCRRSVKFDYAKAQAERKAKAEEKAKAEAEALAKG